MSAQAVVHAQSFRQTTVTIILGLALNYPHIICASRHADDIHKLIPIAAQVVDDRCDWRKAHVVVGIGKREMINRLAWPEIRCSRHAAHIG